MNPRLIGIVIVVVVAVVLVWTLRNGEDTSTQSAPLRSLAEVGGDSTGAPAIEEPAPAPRDEAPASRDVTTAAKEQARRAQAEKSTPRAPGDERGEGAIYGTVMLKEDGAKVADATVELERTDSDDYPNPRKDALKLSATTNAQGEFEFKRLAFGSYTMRVAKDTLIGVGESRPSASRPDAEATVELQPGGSVAGVVKTQGGAVVAGALVFPHKREEDGDDALSTRKGIGMRAESAEDGTFAVTHLWDGRWQFVVKTEEYATLITDFHPLGTTDAELILPEGGSLSGTVTHAKTGDPVPGAKVNVRSEEVRRDRSDVTTDDTGAFQVANLLPGEYKLRLNDDFLVPVDDPIELTVVAGRASEGHRIKGTDGGAIRGRVYDEATDAGVAGIKVSANPEGHSGPGRSSEETDAEGNYEIKGLGEGAYRLYRGYKAGLPRSNRNDRLNVTVALTETLEGIDFPIRMGLTLSGKVMDEGGAGLPRVELVVRSNSGNLYERVQSREGGWFEANGLSPMSDVHVIARKSGYAAKPVGPLEFAAPGLSGVEVSMQAESTISGVVVDGRGRPVPKAVVRGLAGKNHMASLSATAEEDGTFEITQVYPGTFGLKPYPAGNNSWNWENPQVEIAVAAGETVTDVELVLDEEGGLSISGRVTNVEGEPLDQGNIHVYGGSGHSKSAETDKEGHYEVKGLAEGNYQVNVYRYNYSQQNEQNIAAGSTGIDFVLEATGTIEGVVVDATNGEPIADFEIGQTQGRRDSLEYWMRERLTRTRSETGAFALNDVQAGEATVFARASGYSMAVQPVNGVNADSPITGVVIELEPGMQVSGTVTNSAGEPVSGAMLYIGRIPDQWRRERAVDTRTDASGAFTLDGLRSSDTQLAAYYPGYAPASVSITPGRDAQVDIVLSSGGAVEGTIRHAGTPVAGANASVNAQQGGHLGQTQTDADGFYRIEGLTPGMVRVTASFGEDSGRRHKTAEAEIADERVTDVNFNFAATDAGVEGTVTIDGKPVVQGHISAQIKSEDGTTENANAQVKGDGTYLLEGVPTGTIELHINATLDRAMGYRSRRDTVTTRSGQIVQHDVAFTGGGTIRGTVTGIGQGRRAQAILLKGTVQPAESYQDLTSQFEGLHVSGSQIQEDGSFGMTGIDAGTYTLVVFAFIESTSGDPEAMFADAQRGHAPVSVVDGQEQSVNITVR
jgi:hypothetical protein